MKKNTLTLKKRKFNPLAIVLCVVLCIYTASLFALLFWGINTTFKDGTFDFSVNYGFGFPKEFTFKYYQFIFEGYFLKTNDGSNKNIFIEEMIHNSLVYGLGCAFFQTLVPCLTAYVCARFQFKFTKIYYILVIVTMIIPIVGSQASEIMLATNLGLYDELWGLWIMKANFLGLYFLIFFASFKTLPETYTEAAKIDGAGNFRILTRIILPLVRNTFLTIFLINFVNFWNDYSTPLLYLKSRPTIFLSLYYAVQNSGLDNTLSDIPGKLALSVIGILPTFILFAIFNKKLLGSITVGGIK